MERKKKSLFKANAMHGVDSERDRAQHQPEIHPMHTHIRVPHTHTFDACAIDEQPPTLLTLDYSSGCSHAPWLNP